MHQQYIYGLCNPSSTEPLYVGRSKNAAIRRANHVRMGHGDFTPKGIWIKYLMKVGKWPDMVVLEEQSFSNVKEAEAWAKNQEQVWIKRLFEDGVFVFNHGCWWKHPQRKEIPTGVREAWARLHEIFFRLDWWLDRRGESYIESTRFMAYRGIRGLLKQYPGLYVAPLKWIELPGLDSDGTPINYEGLFAERNALPIELYDPPSGKSL